MDSHHRVVGALRSGIACLFLLIAIVAPVAAAHAASSGTQGTTAGAYTVNFASAGFATQTATGPQATIDVYLPGPGPVIFGSQSALTLNYSRSSLLDPTGSSFSVLVNNVSVAERLLSGGVDGPTSVTVPVPAADLVGNGYNHVQITMNLHDRVAVCRIYDPALNVTVYNTSALSYDVQGPATTRFQPDLAQLPAPFIVPGSTTARALTIALPARPTASELTGAGQVLARLGEDAPSAPPAVTTVRAEALPRAALGTNLLLLGTPQDNQGFAAFSGVISSTVHLAGGLWRDAANRALPDDEGLILETANPWDARWGALLITGNGQQGVRRASTVLGSATLRRLLHGTYALVPSAPTVPPTHAVPHDGATLADWGYGPVTLEGLGDHSTQYHFDLTHTPVSPGTFTLVFGHSSTVVSMLSSVRVDLNNHPIASRRFNYTDPPRTWWKMDLPVQTLRAGPNVLTIRFFLQASVTNCVEPPYSSLWGTVESSSLLAIPSDGRTAAVDLSLLPFPLVHDGDPGDTVIVVPATVAVQQDALNMAVLLGSLSRVDAPQLSVVPAGSVTDAMLAGHTVVLDGVPANNPDVERALNGAPLQVSAGAASLRLAGITTALQASVHEDSGLGVIEVVPSPWDATQTALVITATRPDLLPLARHAIYGGHLSGLAATVDAQGRIQTFDTRAAIGIGDALPAPVNRPITGLTILGLGLLALLSIAGGIAARSRRGVR